MDQDPDPEVWKPDPEVWKPDPVQNCPDPQLWDKVETLGPGHESAGSPGRRAGGGGSESLVIMSKNMPPNTEMNLMYCRQCKLFR